MLIWLRHEPRPNEARTPLLPSGAAALIAKGWRVVVEDAPDRCSPTSDYAQVGCDIMPAGSWANAPDDAIILGLKELPDGTTPLHHRHIMFGHAYKGQIAGRALLDRFKLGGGVLFDIETLVDDTGRRVAAFGYWAGFAGAAVSLMAWAAQQRGALIGPVDAYSTSDQLIRAVKKAVLTPPSVLIIGALGRVGNGAADLCRAIGIAPTSWDIAETMHGGPYPEILTHDIFLNCILAHSGTPVFVPADTRTQPRALSVIGDIACDPDSPFTPIPVNNQVTSWAEPTVRVHATPTLDVMAIDNLPSLLARDSSADFAKQLQPHLLALDQLETGVWARAKAQFDLHA